MSKAQQAQERTDIDLPNGMTKAEAREACKRTAERDNAMSGYAQALLDRL